MDDHNHEHSSAHLFSSLIWASSSGVKSLVMLKVCLISSGLFPMLMGWGTFDEGGYFGATQLYQRSDVQIVGGQQELQKLLLVFDVDEFLVPGVH